MVNHEAVDTGTEIDLRDLPFEPRRILDYDNGQPVAFTAGPGNVRLRESCRSARCGCCACSRMEKAERSRILTFHSRVDTIYCACESGLPSPANRQEERRRKADP